MSDLKFTCTGCRNGCVITVCYNEEGYPDVKGNGCMRGVLYANDKVRAMDEKETDKKMLKSYVAFDIETTGLSPEHNEIIEIGALKVREGKVVDRFIRFIEPEAGIPPMITQLTGITNDMVEGAGNCEIGRAHV